MEYVAEPGWCGLGVPDKASPSRAAVFILLARQYHLSSLVHANLDSLLPHLHLCYPFQLPGVIMAEESNQPTTTQSDAPNLDGDDEVSSHIVFFASTIDA